MQIEFEGHAPQVHPSAWIAPGAVLIGRIHVAADASVWFGAVARGDIEPIRIGARTNVQDNVTIHVTGGRHPTTIGEDVTIGHGAIVHGCAVGDGALIGMGAILMDGAVVGPQSLVAAGSLVTPGTAIAERTLAVGRPARPLRPLTDDEIAGLAASAARYVALAARHRGSGGRPPGAPSLGGSADGS
jgi:carbonic anhydrase/acetyltransferase-like protein (isoleucine patch superfamily)